MPRFWSGGGASQLMRTVDDDNLIKICKKNEEDGELIEKMVSLSEGCIAHQTLQVQKPLINQIYQSINNQIK